MANYAVFFDYNNITYRLPVNPESITETSAQANTKYDILKLGQIVIPSNIKLKTYSFTCEFPCKPIHYAETINNFKPGDFYIKLFEKIKKDLKPVRFIASNSVGNEINTLVLIESLEIKEKAGEEGDKYISFTLIEYKCYSKKSVIINNSSYSTISNKVGDSEVNDNIKEVNPKINKTYIVKKGDTLWAIAKVYYGDGRKYKLIASKNKDIIKNPALIYPGQKLVIPI